VCRNSGDTILRNSGDTILNQAAKCGADYPVECRGNVEEIFPVSYDKGLIWKAPPGGASLLANGYGNDARFGSRLRLRLETERRKTIDDTGIVTGKR